MQTQKLGKFSILAFMLGFSILLVFVLLGWWYWSSRQENPVPIQKSIQHPFATYKRTLQNAPDPTQLFEEFSNLLAFSASMPGWRISHIHYESNGYVADIKPQGQLSSLRILEAWLKDRGLKYVLKKESIQFFVSSKALKRTAVPDIQNLNQTSATAIDQIKSMLPVGADIQLENEGRKVGLSRGRRMNIYFSSASPDVLVLLGQTLLKFPVLIQVMDFSMDNNLLSGSLELMALGK